jgi:hypothetical protein
LPSQRTIYFNEDGSGKVEVVELRDEYSYMQIAGANYSKKKSTSTHPTLLKFFKYNDTFLKFTKPEQELFITYMRSMCISKVLMIKNLEP